jgi:hypothetical protein
VNQNEWLLIQSSSDRIGVEVTTKFFDWKLRTGDQKAWSKFVLSPGTAITVERLSGSIGK